jgi:hypothetical protein
MSAELIAIILDGIPLQRGNRDYHDLVGALFLERFEVGRKPLLIRRFEQVRVVDHSACERGERGLGKCGRKAHHQREAE